MKRYFYVLALLAIAGCKHEVIVPGGTVTTDSSGKVTKVESQNGSMEVNGDKMTVKGKDGTVAETNASVTEADLGAPFYPGSTEMPGSFKITEKDAAGKDKMAVTSIRSTTDSGKQVVDFYVGKLGPAKQTTQTTGTSGMAMADWEKDGKVTTVIVSTADGKSTIQITSGTK